MKNITRITLSLLLAAAMLAGGCAKVTPTPSPSPAAEATNTPTKAPEFDIVTSGGAVLVGKVVKTDPNSDANESGSYCLKLDAPMSFKLTTENEPAVFFKDCDKILLYDSMSDEIDKSAYEDMDVTIKGVLQDFCGSGILYVHVCYIEADRSEETCHADETITIGQTDKWVSDYDPSMPLNDKVKPLVKNGVYAFNPYVLNMETIKHLGNEFPEFYIGFVDAFLNYETSCKCDIEYYADMFPLFLIRDFPLFELDGIIGDVITYNDTEHTLNWTYKVKKSEHEKLIKSLETAVNKYLNLISESDSDIVKAQKLYHAFSMDMNYDYEAMETRKNTEVYHAFIDHSGICTTFSGAYAYLLSSVGVENLLVSANFVIHEGDDISGHAWNIVTLGGKNYFCDPTYEEGTDGGKGYKYFGMTMEDRLNDGSEWDMDTILIATYQLLKLDEIELSKTRLDVTPVK